MKEYALITGASSGIGAALALTLAKQGYNIIALGQNTSKLDKLAYIITTNFELDVLTYKIDLTNVSATKCLLKKLKLINKNITFFINNAGVGYFGKFSDISLEEDIKTINLNILACTTFLKEMLTILNTDAKIIMVASTAGFAPGPYMATYYASKAYILNLSLALRSEGLNISILAPGPTKTNFQSRANMQKSKLAHFFAMDPTKVATIAYKGALKNQAIIIPGFFNKICVIVLLLAPYKLKTAFVKKTNQTKN
ncbi:MAG: hypothetical protein ATN31_07725 [Candidatus Epulonipiscioides saccharophilum]|nr:MAG: hypothetical protein ATN31_07725 [Epulopiscium sp. AS2M-Bin001]